MKVVWPNGNEFRVGQVTGIDGQNHLPNYPSNGWGDEFPDRTKGLPDFRDAATLGCLLALVRRAWGDPCMYLAPADGWYVGKGGRDSMPGEGPTEAAALVAALEAAP
jgi:hypothetical protein